MKMPTPERIVEEVDVLGHQIREFLDKQPDADEVFRNKERKEILGKMKFFVKDLRNALKIVEQILTLPEHQLDGSQRQELEAVKAEAEEYINQLTPILDKLYDKFGEINKKIDLFFAEKDTKREFVLGDENKKVAQSIKSTQTPAGDGLPHGPKGGRFNGGKGFRNIR